MAAVAAGATLAGCSSGDAAEKDDAVDTSQVVVTMTPESEPASGFDPFYSWGCGEHVHEPLIQSTLVKTDADLEIQPELATAYEGAADGLTWTFTLREDAKFSDGEPVTAADAAFTINGIKTNEAAELDLSSVKEAVATDDYTLEVRMERPDNTLLYSLAVMGIVPEHAYGSDYGSAPIGSGPYMLEQWDRGQQVILKANPDYYGEAPIIKRVVVLFMEEDASLAAASSGEADVAYTSATLAASVPAGYTLLDVKTVDSRGISLPCVPAGSPAADQGDGVEYPVGNDVTSDIAIRRALNYGVDRDSMIESVLNGYGTAAYSVASGTPWVSEDSTVGFDTQKALDLLDGAGWVAGDDGIRSKDGVRASFDLYYSAGDSVRQALANDFANQAKALGIEANVKGASWDDIYPHEYEQPVLWGWGSNSPIEFYELTYSTGWGNFSSYSNADIDKMLEEGISQIDVDDSFQYYKLAQWDPDTQQGVATQGAATWVWLADVDHLYFKRDGLVVSEQKPHPHGHGWSIVNDVDTWYWD
jgi:peptide/nickel transport system substrate-binding protein